MGFSKNPLLDPYNPRWLRSAILKKNMMSFFFCRGWSDLDKISQTEKRMLCILVSKQTPFMLCVMQITVFWYHLPAWIKMNDITVMESQCQKSSISCFALLN